MGRNSSTYKQASAWLMERFPRLGLLSSSWEATPLVDESLPPFAIEKAEVLYIYGLGTGKGYFQCREWLKQKPERELVFLEDESGVIASFLHRREALEILSDLQVHLELFSGKNGEIEALAERFPVKRVEVLALPSKKRVASLRLKLLRKTALSHALHLDRLHGYQPFENFVQNVRQMSRSFYANALQGAFQGIPAIVCGAGPSLQHSIDLLRKMENRALIIAGGSTLAALSSQGVLPHFGMAVDPNLEEYRRLKNSFAFEVPLLYSTRVFPKVFQTCNGPFGYMRSGIGGAPELWMEEELGLLDPLLGDFLSPESISVTAICVAWAQFLGCNPILLNGVDLAYTGNKRYAAGVTEEEEIAFQAIDAEKSAADRIIKKKDRLGKPIYTAVRWVMEAASLSHFAKKHPEVRFVNTTEGGIGFQGIDDLPLGEVVAPFEERDLRWLVHQKIAAAPMPPHTEEMIQTQMEELRGSLLRVIDHLQVLSGEKKGSAALSEMELKEEIAFLTLFYDMESVIRVELRQSFSPERLWKKLLELAFKYKIVVYST